MLHFNFDPFPVLETHRLILRSVSETDLPEIFQLRSNAEVFKYIAKKPIENMEEASLFLKKIIALQSEKSSVLWAITLKGQDKLIGNISLWNLQPENHRGELGYTLLPDFHRKGIMQEAAEVVIRYGFDTLNLHSIEAHTNPLNTGSVKILERAQFVKEAHFKENKFWNGKYHDTVVYTLMQKNFVH